MIEIKDFSKKYGELTVYENFNLSLEEGKVTCILGESGSGKTTLLNAIASLTDYSGEITKLKCSYIFQTPRLVPNLTVFRNLKLICNDESKIYDMLERVHLSDKAQCYPVSLSGGQAQRVAIARAFLYDSDVLLMDEPFSSLDLKVKAEIIGLFFELWKKDGRTSLFVTHDIDEAATLSHRIIVINGGKIVYDKTPGTQPPRMQSSAEELRRELISVLL